MNSDGGIRAISGFLFQVLVGGSLRAAGECRDCKKSDSSELDALVELARTGEVVHEFADEDLMVRNFVVGPASAANAEITLVQVKFSARGPANSIGPAELGKIIAALENTTRHIEKLGERVTGYVLVTNRTITPSKPPLRTKVANAIYDRLQRVEGAAISTWHDNLTNFARRFGRRDDEIEAGRQRLLGLIFEATTTGTSKGIITRADLLRCLCGDERAQELNAAKLAATMQQQVAGFDVDHRRIPVRRERMASIERECAGRALVIFAGSGGSGKTAALHDWTTQLANSASTTNAAPLVAMLTARELPEDWLSEAVSGWNPALRPVNANEALQRLRIGDGGSVPLLHLALDGADEYPGDATIEGRVRRLAKWFWEQDKAALGGDPLHARLVITCRNATDFAYDWLMLRRSGGTLAGGRTPLVVLFDKFSEAELRELLRTNFPELERQLLRDEGTENVSLSIFVTAHASSVSTDQSSPRHPLAELLLDPVMWRAFCEITDETRARLVAGHREEERELAKYFCDRFIEKARVRTLIPRPTLETALASIAADHQAEGRRFRMIDQWQRSAHSSSGMSIPEARKLATEAASGGLIREEAGGRWDWRNDAVELHLAGLFAS